MNVLRRVIGIFDGFCILNVVTATLMLLSSSARAEDLDCGIEATCSAWYFGAENTGNEIVPGCGVRVTPHIPERIIEVAQLKNNKGFLVVKVIATWKLVNGDVRGASEVAKFEISSKDGVRELQGIASASGILFSGDFTSFSLPAEVTLVECRLLEN